MAFKLDKSNFNFGKGTNHDASDSPTKIGWKASMAAEGYYKAGKNLWDKWQKKKEQNRIAEENAVWEKHQKDWEKFKADPNVDPREKIVGANAMYGMVNVWDPKLGRNKMVYDIDAYYTKMEKEGKDPVTGQSIKHLENVQKENEEKEKQEKLKLEEQKKQENFKEQIYQHGEIIDPSGEKPIDTSLKEDKKEKVPAVGTDARKEYYDSKKWKYDDTIKGYNKDGTEKKNEVEVKEKVVVEDNKKKKKRDTHNKSARKADGTRLGQALRRKINKLKEKKDKKKNIRNFRYNV